MDKLASIVQQLQQERARIDAALHVLTESKNQTPKLEQWLRRCESG
jgi:hypothetical protein